jgi:hypothetical protein
MLFDFVPVEEACRSVSAVIAAGIVPAAMEIMDQHTVELVESWLHIGLPLDAGAVLLIEVDGAAVSLPEQVSRISSFAVAQGARSTGWPKDDAERAAIWRGRKSAFGAVRQNRERVLHHGRRGAAHAARRGAVDHLPPREGARARSRQRVPRRRRQSSSARAVRRRRPAGAGRALEARSRSCACASDWRHDLGRARRRHREALDDDASCSRLRTSRPWARSGARSIPTGLLNPLKILPGGAGCGEGARDARRAARRTRRGVPAQMGGMRPRDDAEGPWI